MRLLSFGAGSDEGALAKNWAEAPRPTSEADDKPLTHRENLKNAPDIASLALEDKWA
jgi:hypothetical protein